MHNLQHSIYKLEGVIKHYVWGGKKFIAELLSRPAGHDKPVAEYWLGAHPLSSSSIMTETGKILLKDFIAKDKERILGHTVAKKFGGLPYLMKVLDVSDLLSIQVHPSKHEAEVGYQKENELHIPPDAPQRNYKDENHKPELMVALSEFWLLHGFKPLKALTRTLKTIPVFSPLFEILDATGYDQLYKTVMEMPQETVNEILTPLLNNIVPLYEKNRLSRNDQNFWAAKAALLFNEPATASAPAKIDRGIFSIYFFNLVHLQAGEGIFQDAGVPHTYLEGQNIEIMASSDNVLRGGLTKKHIDVKELMRHMKFEETIPQVVSGNTVDANTELFLTAAPDFKLRRYRFQAGQQKNFHAASAEIIFVLDGNLFLKSNDSNLALSKGEAAFVLADTSVQIETTTNADLFRASVPVHIGE